MQLHEDAVVRAATRALAAELRGPADDGRELTVVELVRSCGSHGVSPADKLAEALTRAATDRQ